WKNLSTVLPHTGFQTPRFAMTPGSSRRRTGAAFFPFCRWVLETGGLVDTLVHYCRCGHVPDSECRGPFQESHRCLHTPGAKSSLKTGSVFTTASPDASPSFAARTRAPSRTI